MRVLRSRQSLSGTPTSTLIPSAEPFTPPMVDSSPNASPAVTSVSSITNSRRRLSLRLANKFSSPVTVASDGGDDGRNRTSNASADGGSSDSGEKRCLQLRSRSVVSRRRQRFAFHRVEKEEKLAVIHNGGSPGNGVEVEVDILRGKHKPNKDYLKTLITSPEPFTPSVSDSSPDNFTTANSVASITNSRCRVIQRLACKVTSPAIVAADDGAVKRMPSFKVSSERFTGSNHVLEEMEMVTNCDEGGPSDGAEVQEKIVGGKNEQGSIAMASSLMDEYRSVEGVVQDADCLMEEGEKKREDCHSTQNDVQYMSLRSGSRLPKRKIGDDGIDSFLVRKKLGRFSGKKVKRANGLSPHPEISEKPVDTMFINLEEVVSENGGGSGKENNMQDGLAIAEDELSLGGTSSFDDQEVGKSVLLESGFEIFGRQDFDLNVVPIPEEVHEEIMIDEGLINQRQPKRFTWKEKGKEKLPPKDFGVIKGEQSSNHEVELNNANFLREKKGGGSLGIVSSRREASRNIAKELAHQFAFFKADEEEEIDKESEVDDSMLDTEENEDWPGPFSTAMKIIKERETLVRARSLHFSSQNEKAEVKIPWTPFRGNSMSSVKHAPSLKDLCLKVLSDNAEEIESLEGLPDTLKNSIAALLCRSRKMSFRILCLLTKGSPMEIYLSDCSWATEKQFGEVFSNCNIINLKVLQLDLCGRCLPDYVLRSTLAKATNSLPSLSKLSLKGAYCLSDSGLDAIVSSAPLLKSLNLSQCSLITSKGIISLAENLGPVLEELYIDICHNIDAMLILPALKKMQVLEVLSISHLETVTDKFLKNLIRVSGSKLRGLIVAGCCKLTNASIKTIGESCPLLSCLDIRHLNRLNDSAIMHLSNGGCPFQSLKVCHGAFSDEALAAFLEASGAAMVELVLNNIEKAAGNTALAISRRCSSTLRSLDLSFCRKMTDEALGLIVDSCSNLRILKLFGCTQVTNHFLEGHSNPLVKIVGLTGSILDELEMPDFG